MDIPEYKYKRVSVSEPNLILAQEIADKMGKPLGDYLDFLINRAIVEDHNKTKPQLYVWKS